MTVSFAQSLRYPANYVSKSKNQRELLDEVLVYLGKRMDDGIPPNMKQAVSLLILADSSHSAFISKHEVACIQEYL